MNKLKAFYLKYKKQIKQIILFLIICICLSLIAFAILYFTDVLTFEDGLKFNEEMFTKLTTNWYGYLIFYILQVVLTIVLCFAPGGTTTFIALAVVLFGTNLKSFLLLYAGVITSSVLMDLLGRFGGVPLIKKMFGEDDYKKAEKILKEKGTVYLPFMYLFPLFPDDLLCCLAGISKINFWYHLLIITVFRGVGVATIVFGLELIPYQHFSTPYEYIECLLIIFIGIYYVFKIARFLDKWLTKYIKRKEEHLINSCSPTKFQILKSNKVIFIIFIIFLIIFIAGYLSLGIYYIIENKFTIAWDYIILIFLIASLIYFTYRLFSFFAIKLINFQETKTLTFIFFDIKNKEIYKFIILSLCSILCIISLSIIIYSYILIGYVSPYNVFKLIVLLMITIFFFIILNNYLISFLSKRIKSKMV